MDNLTKFSFDGQWTAMFGGLIAHVSNDKLTIKQKDNEVVAIFGLAPRVNGVSTRLQGFTDREGVLTSAATELSAVTIRLWIESNRVHYSVDSTEHGPMDLCIFPESTFPGPTWATFVSDVQDDAWRKSEAHAVKVSSAVDIEGEGARNDPSRWVIAPPPRACAMEYGQGWLSVVVPDALPVAETIFDVNKYGLFSVDFNHFVPGEGAGGGIELALSGGLRTRYAALDELSAVSIQRGLASIGPAPEWWSHPLFCTYGEQIATADAETSDSDTLTASSVRDWVSTLEAKVGSSAFNIIIDAPWFSNSGDYIAHEARFGGDSGLRALIADLHAAGHKVILWMTPFDLNEKTALLKNVPDGALRLNDGGFARGRGTSRVADFTHPGVREHYASAIRRMMTDLDADGFKIDFLYSFPDSRLTKPFDPTWGSGDQLFRNIVRLIADSARAEKADAMLSISSVMPYLQPHAGALRLNDNFSRDVTTWHKRARLITRTMPGTLIDCDAWPLYAEDAAAHWLSAPAYGIPAVYHLTKLDDGSSVTENDFHLIAASWAVYGNAPIGADHRTDVDPDLSIIERRYLDGALAAKCIDNTVLMTFSATEIRICARSPFEVEVPIPDGRSVVQAQTAIVGEEAELLEIGDLAARPLIVRVPSASDCGQYLRLTLS